MRWRSSNSNWLIGARVLPLPPLLPPPVAMVGSGRPKPLGGSIIPLPSLSRPCLPMLISLISASAKFRRVYAKFNNSVTEAASRADNSPDASCPWNLSISVSCVSRSALAVLSFPSSPKLKVLFIALAIDEKALTAMVASFWNSEPIVSKIGPTFSCNFSRATCKRSPALLGSSAIFCAVSP